MTIVSTASSGGGSLADYGVFHNEKVYTLYLSMKASDDDPAPSWTMQYAVLQPDSANNPDGFGKIQGTPTPPYAMLKEVPQFTPDLLRKAAHQLIVALAILDPIGKLGFILVGWQDLAKALPQKYGK